MRNCVEASADRDQRTIGPNFFTPISFFVLLAVASAQVSIASPVTLIGAEQEGTLEVMVEDYKDHAVTRHFLEAEGRRTELHLKGRHQDLASGAEVRIKGARRADESIDVAYLSLTESGSASTSTATSAPTRFLTYGAQSTLVILVNFQDKPTEQPWTPSQVRSFMFNTISDVIVENSYQQASLTGDVYGWYTIPLNSTVCDQTAIANAAKSAATAAGANPSVYARHVYLFPKGACQFSGASTVSGSPSQAWINGEMTVQVVGHELGHSFGLQHSRGLNCNGETLGTNCQTMEYGDTVDPMGNAPTGHFNAYQKERLGWLNSGGSSPPIITVERSGTYTIDNFEVPGGQPKALRILRSFDASTGWKTWYYVELRQAVGSDGWMSGSLMVDTSNVLNGVVVHSAPEYSGDTSVLLDMTPETRSLRDPALVVGRSYSDANAGVTITTDGLIGGTATVTVFLAGGGWRDDCTRANPTMTLVGPTQSAAPGATVSFSVSVQNNDSLGCDASSFELARTVPAGWTGLLGKSTLMLAPGESALTTLSITSIATAADGSYQISADVVDASTATYADSSSALLVIAAGKGGGKPTGSGKGGGKTFR